MSSQKELDKQGQRFPPLATPSTCEWFMKLEKVKIWLGSTCNSLLLVSGPPWCGKSVLAGFVVETLQVESQTTVGYYCFGCDKMELNLELENASKIPELEDARNALDQLACQIQKRENNRDVQAEDYFNQSIENSQCDRIICILDSLDGCTPESLQSFMCILKKCILKPRSEGTLKILATTRPDLKYLNEFHEDNRNFLKILWEHDDIRQGSQEDVRTVINERLHELNVQQHDVKQAKEAFQISFDYRKSPYLWVDMVFEVLNVLLPGTSKALDWKKLVDSSPQESMTTLRKFLESTSTHERSQLPAPGFKGRQHPLYRRISKLLEGHLRRLLGAQPKKQIFELKRQQKELCCGKALSADGPSIAVIKGDLVAVWRAHDGTDQLWWAKLSLSNQDQNSEWTDPEKVHETAKTNARPSTVAAGDKLVALWKGREYDESLWYSVYRFDKGYWSWENPIRTEFGSKTGPALALYEKDKVLGAWAGIKNDDLLWQAVFDFEKKANVDKSGNWGRQYPNYLDIRTDYRPALAFHRGRLYLAWTSTAHETAQQILVSTRSHRAEFWDPPASVQKHCHSSAAPTLCNFKGKIYVAWRGKSNDCGIWLAPCPTSQDPEHPELPQRLDNVATSCTPALAEWQDELIIAWKGWANDPQIWWGSVEFKEAS